MNWQTVPRPAAPLDDVTLRALLVELGHSLPARRVRRRPRRIVLSQAVTWAAVR